MFGVGGPVRTRARTLLKLYARYRPPEVDQRLRSLAVLAVRADADLFLGSDLTRYELSVFSQNGEDGVVIEILNRIGVVDHYFVEFGIQDGTQGNCVVLADVMGWSGLFIEADDADHARVSAKYAGTDVRVLHDLVTAERFTQILTEAGVPAEFDVLSIDIDGNDVHVWDALEGFRPRLVVIEYNSGIAAPGPVAQRYEPRRAWDGGTGWGSTLAGFDRVADRHGYRLAHTDLTGTNAFYVRTDLWDRLGVTRSPRRTQNLGLTGLHRPPSDPPGGWVEIR
jgi:hypothetical protein